LAIKGPLLEESLTVDVDFVPKRRGCVDGDAMLFVKSNDNAHPLKAYGRGFGCGRATPWQSFDAFDEAARLRPEFLVSEL
jgi:hypothetical protein